MKLTETQEVTMQIARKGYESYAGYTGNKSAVTGDDLPKWDDLPGSVVNAWFAAATGMIEYMAELQRKGVVVVPDPPAN